jgi:hypothetical protein
MLNILVNNIFKIFFYAATDGGVFRIFQTFVSHNVPAVYDVFAVAIKETVGFQQPQKCGGEKPHKGRSPTAVFRSPSRLLAAKHIQTCYMPYTRTPHDFYIIPFLICNIILYTKTMTIDELPLFCLAYST